LSQEKPTPTEQEGPGKVSNDTDNTRNEARKPVIYNGDLQALPQAQGLRALTSLEIWALWRAIPKTDKAGNTKVTKPPFQPSGSYANPAEASTFSSLEDCLAAMAARPGHYDGVGVRVPDDVCALDLDGVMEENRPDTLNPWVRALIDRLRCYCEITPSGRGVRIFIGYSGEKLPRTKFKIPDGEGNIEVYCRANHFVTITNNPFPDTLPRIADHAGASGREPARAHHQGRPLRGLRRRPQRGRPLRRLRDGPTGPLG
jgi:primase-polymerase (primpol)-like protein